MITITIKPENAADETRFPARELKFKNNASVRLEIFPTIFKSKYLSTGTVVWIDAKRMCKRYQNQTIVRPLMAPIRISNTGFGDAVGKLFEAILTRGNAVTIVNSHGERFLVSYKCDNVDSSERTETAEVTSDRESMSTVKMTPVPLSKSVSPVTSIFASVSGYVPKDVSNDIH